MSVIDLGSGQPFKQYALEYFQRGWLPLPLPPGEKSPPPVGFTGHHDPATLEDIEGWVADQPDRANIGIRTPDGIIGIDVDAYSGKQGAAGLGELSEKWGSLPPTFILSARGDGISGIRFYRVPKGKSWPGEVAPDIQVIQYRHRYAVAFPSVHPKLKKMYQWYPPGCPINGRSPNPSGIPDMHNLTDVSA